jgi:predicted N-acetyltransferase YhbS
LTGLTRWMGFITMRRWVFRFFMAKVEKEIDSVNTGKNMRHIRQGQETDFDKIRQVISLALRQCVVGTDEHYDFLYSDVCNGLDWWIENKKNGLLLVCEDGGSILGVALVKGFWNFAALFVDPQRHRSGIGRELVTSVINGCKHKSPKGYLRLNSSNYATDFYKKMGFIQIADAVDLPGGCVPLKYDF